MEVEGYCGGGVFGNGQQTLLTSYAVLGRTVESPKPADFDHLEAWGNQLFNQIANMVQTSLTAAEMCVCPETKSKWRPWTAYFYFLFQFDNEAASGTTVRTAQTDQSSNKIWQSVAELGRFN